jgi:very-short-patch-repair endonuclease
LRRNQTEAENAAWYVSRGRRLDAKFRRQCRIEIGLSISTALNIDW